MYIKKLRFNKGSKMKKLKLKIGDKVELNHDLDYAKVIIKGFDVNERGEIAYSDEVWFYMHQIISINGRRVKKW
tara:strand:+ start:1220 stop:1441 length:222 start_codon:yes stop_codon:yes gene_type:complete